MSKMHRKQQHCGELDEQNVKQEWHVTFFLLLSCICLRTCIYFCQKHASVITANLQNKKHAACLFEKTFLVDILQIN